MAEHPLQKYAADFVAFAADLHVPLGAASGRLGDNWAPFQQRDFDAMAPSLLAVAMGKVPAVRRFWIERTKGGSKDSDVAVAVLWLLTFAPRAIRCQVGAYDREQASELRYIIKAILDIDAPLNRLLAQVVEVQSPRIVAHANTAGRSESECQLLTTDAYGSHGARPDVVIANELTHVGSEAFMQTLMDNADKVPHSLVIVATNSGEVGTWQEKWRDIARESERWHVSVLNEPAPWVSPDDLAESQRRNPAHRFARLWKGIWSSGEGNGLDLAIVQEAFKLKGPQGPRSDRVYVAGLETHRTYPFVNEYCALGAGRNAHAHNNLEPAHLPGHRKKLTGSRTAERARRPRTMGACVATAGQPMQPQVYQVLRKILLVVRD